MTEVPPCHLATSCIGPPHSLGILIGGMAAIAPERHDEIVALGLRSIVAGTLATLMVG